MGAALEPPCPGARAAGSCTLVGSIEPNSGVCGAALCPCPESQHGMRSGAPSSPNPTLPQLKPATTPSRDTESGESGPSGHPAPGASVSRQDGRAAPRPGARWVGAAGGPAVPGGRRSPTGHGDAAWTGTEVLSASTSFPARSRFPPASRARCGAVAARGVWHGIAPHGLVGSPAPAGRMERPWLWGVPRLGTIPVAAPAWGRAAPGLCRCHRSWGSC